jgi:hypothetical protein
VSFKQTVRAFSADAQKAGLTALFDAMQRHKAASNCVANALVLISASTQPRVGRESVSVFSTLCDVFKSRAAAAG